MNYSDFRCNGVKMVSTCIMMVKVISVIVTDMSLTPYKSTVKRPVGEYK